MGPGSSFAINLDNDKELLASNFASPYLLICYTTRSSSFDSTELFLERDRPSKQTRTQ